MDSDGARSLLTAVADGSVAVQEALDRLGSAPLAGYDDLGFARVDTNRGLRTGDAEVVYGAGKTVEQAVQIVASLRAAGPERPTLVTRARPELSAALTARFADVAVDDEARAVTVGALPGTRGTVTVLSAGTSDGPVAAEAALTARVFGAGVERISDVGVAGLHRLLAVRPQLEQADCLIVVAGMDGALPSAVAGLVGVPVVAVPTSVGYGASFSGLAPLLTMLSSCAPGVVVTNIDNGFGAGVAAARIARGTRGARGDNGGNGDGGDHSDPAGGTRSPGTDATAGPAG